MDASAIDRAIDDAAREMTAGEPSPAFRVQVMDRLGERRRVWRSPWLLSPIAIAVVVLIAAVLPRPVPQRTDREMLAGRPITVTASIPERPARAFAATAASPQAAAPPQTQAQPQSDVAALAPPRLEVSSLALTAMAPGESLEIPELETIAPIIVAPIGDPQGERR